MTREAYVDLELIRERLKLFPNLRSAYARRLRTSPRIRLGAAPIPLEWLTYWTPRRRRMLSGIERQLNAIRNRSVPGYRDLVRRLGDGDRNNAFGILAEIFVTAWYVRSAKDVLAVGEKVTAEGSVRDADITLRDGNSRAYVEVFETAGSASFYNWQESWEELDDRLRELAMDCVITVTGGSYVKENEVAPGVWLPGEELVPALQLDEIALICRRVAQEAENVPVELPATAFGNVSKHYPRLSVQLKPGPRNVFVWRSSSGARFSPEALARKILKKPRRIAGLGRTVLIVEVTRMKEDTMRERWASAMVSNAIARTRPGWDAILAFERDWTSGVPRTIRIIVQDKKSRAILPKLKVSGSAVRSAKLAEGLLASVKALFSAGADVSSEGT